MTPTGVIWAQRDEIKELALGKSGCFAYGEFSDVVEETYTIVAAGPLTEEQLAEIVKEHDAKRQKRGAR